jgi:hypothetical protein
MDWFDILKWVLIVLAAGFIGQFGKRLADHLVSRARNRRITASSPPPLNTPAGKTHEAGSGHVSSEAEKTNDLGTKAEAKMVKKAIKAEIKRRK